MIFSSGFEVSSRTSHLVNPRIGASPSSYPKFSTMILCSNLDVVVKCVIGLEPFIPKIGCTRFNAVTPCCKNKILCFEIRFEITFGFALHVYKCFFESEAIYKLATSEYKICRKLINGITCFPYCFILS